MASSASTWFDRGERGYSAVGMVPCMSTVVDSHASLGPRSTAANRRLSSGNTRHLHQPGRSTGTFE